MIKFFPERFRPLLSGVFRLRSLQHCLLPPPLRWLPSGVPATSSACICAFAYVPSFCPFLTFWLGAEWAMATGSVGALFSKICLDYFWVVLSNKWPLKSFQNAHHNNVEFFTFPDRVASRWWVSASGSGFAARTRIRRARITARAVRSGRLRATVRNVGGMWSVEN